MFGRRFTREWTWKHPSIGTVLNKETFRSLPVMWRCLDKHNTSKLHGKNACLFLESFTTPSEFFAKSWNVHLHGLRVTVCICIYMYIYIHTYGYQYLPIQLLFQLAKRQSHPSPSLCHLFWLRPLYSRTPLDSKVFRNLQIFIRSVQSACIWVEEFVTLKIIKYVCMFVGVYI